MAIASNFPNLRPSLLLDFSSSQQLDPRVTFTRSTTAPYYDGKTSVLAEQNLLLQSNTFTNASWVATNATIASGVTAPDGTSSAFSMTATGANATLYQTVTLTATAYTESIWIQRVTGTGTINLTLDGTTLSPVSITGSWAKYTYTATPTAGAKTVGIQVVTSGDVINIYGSQLENRSSATATNITTTSAITNYIPQLLTAPINAPRFDFNPTTGESLGLLIEQSSTNLLTYSQDFTNAVWTKTNATITAAANIAPDGAQTAQSLIADTSTNVHSSQEAVTFTGVGTLVFYAKANQYTSVSITNNPNNYIHYDLTNGNISTLGTGWGSATCISVGNGWYRCSATNSASQTWTFVRIFALNTFIASGNTAPTFTGNGYSGIYIWGAQLEALAFPTSYIPTTSAQVTRASDNASMTGTNFSSWYNNGQGTAYVECACGGVSISPYTISFNDNSVSNVIVFGISSNKPELYVRVNNTIVVDLYTSQPTITNNTFYKQAISFQSANYASSVNGNTPMTSSNANFPIVTQINFGFQPSYVNQMINGRIKKFAYYPQISTSAQLQALTGS